MKPASRRISCLVCAAVVLPRAAFSQDVHLPAAQGRELVLEYCSACHGVERVAHAGGSPNGWTDRIRRMNRLGAKVPAERVQPMANYLAAAFPERPRALSIDTSITSISVSEVAVQPIQTVLRVAGRLDPRAKVVRAPTSTEAGRLLAVGQRVRAFRVDARTSMHQGRVSAVARRDGQDEVEVALASTTDTEPRTYVLEIVADRGESLAVPSEAVVEDGERRLVYVQLPSQEYVPREIEVGIQGERYTQIVAGLQAGDRVVTLGSFFIDAEYRMRGNVEAGGQVRTLAAQGSQQTFTVTLQTRPDPPRSGANEVEVLLSGPDERSIADATVTVGFYMPAMPAMNMPEMHSDFRMTRQRAGLYRGTGHLAMSGAWNVTVTVSRGDEQLGVVRYTVTAK